MNYNIIKEYWNHQPCNSKHSNLNQHTKEYFTNVIEKRRKVEPHNIEFLEPCNWLNKNVLEIGCGIGIDAISLINHKAHYTGIDLSDKSIEFCKKNFEVHNVNGNIFSYNFENNCKQLNSNYFDLVYSYGVIHHAINPKKIIKQARRVIKDTGEFRFMVYASNSWKDMLVKNKLDQYEAQDNCPLVRTYTEKQIKNLLNNYFEIESIERTFIFTYNIDHYKKGEYVKETWFEEMPNDLFTCMEKELGMHYLVTAKPV